VGGGGAGEVHRGGAREADVGNSTRDTGTADVDGLVGGRSSRGHDDDELSSAHP